MINVGIYDGDIIIVQKQKVARNGEIVVALIGEEATVKLKNVRAILKKEIEG